MNAGRWVGLLLVSLCTAVDAWFAVTTRHLWLGHGARTGTMLVTAMTWLGVLMAVLGAHAVVAPQLKGLDAWHRTGVRSEAQLLIAPVRRLAIGALVSSGLVTLCACMATLIAHGFGQPRFGHVLQANLWPVLCLLVGVALTWLFPRSFRWLGMLAAPLLAFWSLMVCRSMSSGPWLTLGPDDSGAGLDAMESGWTVGMRLLLWVSLCALCAGIVWRRRLKSVGAAGISVALTLSALTLPQTFTPIPRADDIACNATGQACWRSWGRAGSQTFADTVQPLIDRTPRAVRPVKVLGDMASKETPPGMLAIGYPAGDELTAVVPNTAQVRRSYAEALVHQGCASSPTDQVFLLRTLNALGMAPDEGLTSWGLTEEQLRRMEPAADTELLDRLAALPTEQFFSILRSRQGDRALCRASAAQWLHRIPR